MKAAQEGSQSLPGRFRGVPDGSTGVSNNPKGLQDTPRRPQDGPQDAPRSNSARGHACDYVCALAKSSRKQLCPAKGLTRCSRAAQCEALVSYLACRGEGQIGGCCGVIAHIRAGLIARCGPSIVDPSLRSLPLASLTSACTSWRCIALASCFHGNALHYNATAFLDFLSLMCLSTR